MHRNNCTYGGGGGNTTTVTTNISTDRGHTRDKCKSYRFRQNPGKNPQGVKTCTNDRCF